MSLQALNICMLATITVVFIIYTHPINKMDEEAANALDSIFVPKSMLAAK